MCTGERRTVLLNPPSRLCDGRSVCSKSYLPLLLEDTHVRPIILPANAYAAADYTTPDSRVRADSLSTLATASDIGVRPGILIDPTKPVAEEAGMSWTDERLAATGGLNIYYDA